MRTISKLLLDTTNCIHPEDMDLAYLESDDVPHAGTFFTKSYVIGEAVQAMSLKIGEGAGFGLTLYLSYTTAERKFAHIFHFENDGTLDLGRRAKLAKIALLHAFNREQLAELMPYLMGWPCNAAKRTSEEKEALYLKDKR
jgi:hypothetical protein